MTIKLLAGAAALAIPLAIPALAFCAPFKTTLGPLKPGYTTVALPEGNYAVTVTLGGPKAASTTIKAELRRLMLENVATKPGQTIKRSFTVNVRTPDIPATGTIAAGTVSLKDPRETVKEAWAWDKALTLEVAGGSAAVRSVEIVQTDSPTLFLLGDSTVCDQPGEPFSSWGAMLPRFLKPGIAVSNHGQSGETLRDSIARRRIDKILASMKPGDTVMFQFGHNDQKQIKAGNGSPTTYKAELKTHVEGVLARGGVPVIVSSMERRRFDDAGRAIPTLLEYADAAREVARDMKVAFIDLNAQSKVLHEALGVDGSQAAFAFPEPGKIDNTHHSNYGGYQLAKIVLQGLVDAKVPVAKFISADFTGYDPRKPDPVKSFAVVASQTPPAERPLGDEANK